MKIYLTKEEVMLAIDKYLEDRDYHFKNLAGIESSEEVHFNWDRDVIKVNIPKGAPGIEIRCFKARVRLPKVKAKTPEVKANQKNEQPT